MREKCRLGSEPRERRFVAAVAWALLAMLVVGSACTGADPLQLCGEIPEAGCPLGRGGTCDDRTCAALYDCRDGKWTLATTCEPADGPPAEEQPDDEDQSDCERPSIDWAEEATGCEPDLQHPDCPASAADMCASAVCLTDCSDFFLCTDAGWTVVAYCADDGQVVLTQ